MNLLNEALLVGASQGFLLCAVILSLRAANPVANRYLALFVGLESLHLFFLHLIYSHSLESPPYWLRLLPGVRIFSAPALYFYVRAMTDYTFRPGVAMLRHLWIAVPVVAWFAYLPTTEGWLVMSTVELQYQRSTIWWSMYQSVVMAGYSVLALRCLNAHMHQLEQALSAIENISLAWLRWLIGAIAVVHIAHVVFDLLRFPQLLGPEPKILLNLSATLLVIYLISIGGLRQSAVFTEPIRNALDAVQTAPPEADEMPSSGDSGKYVKSGLDQTRIGEIWAQLQRLLISERSYLDPGLDLPKLAKQIGVRPQELSQVINTCSGGTFYELINHARVEAAKELLADPAAQRRKMLDIALSVGFSSQSTFYARFKKITGVTPTVYREKIGEGAAPDTL